MAWVAVEDLDGYEVDEGTKRMARAALAALDEIEAAGMGKG
jgi:hypothetical protein